MPRRRTNGGGESEPAPVAPRIVRCAIYTRKSTTEGLDQAFNSLDAQRDACAAYIASQKPLGWQVIPAHYDDGGFGGGNIERPAIRQLLQDVEGGLVDCVVVYKVDRLSRSLLDFARMVKLFEDRQVHFVSVTQHFNTADSMGRLTLNILLSFAQFEREIIAERTRDKIAAARRRGQWAGGRPILGYDLLPREHRLTVNPLEATQVRAIFEMYLEKGSILSTAQVLNARGWTTKRWTAANGNVIGGKRFDRANLRYLLSNVAYLGRVRYRDETHPGQHPAIVDVATWERAQRLLRRNARTAGSLLRNKHGALLKGLLRCKACDAAMVQMVSRKGPRLHRYYVCTKAQKRGYDQCPTGTILAGPLERQVCEHLRRLVQDLSGIGGPESNDIARFQASDWVNLAPQEQARLIQPIVESVQYDGRDERATLTLTAQAQSQRRDAALSVKAPDESGGDGQDSRAAPPASQSRAAMQTEFTVCGLKPARRRRPRSQPPPPVAPVVQTIVLAYQIEQAVREGRAKDYAEVAKQLGMTRARISQVLRLLRLPATFLEKLLLADPKTCQHLSERALRSTCGDSGPGLPRLTA